LLLEHLLASPRIMPLEVVMAIWAGEGIGSQEIIAVIAFGLFCWLAFALRGRSFVGYFFFGWAVFCVIVGVFSVYQYWKKPVWIITDDVVIWSENRLRERTSNFIKVLEVESAVIEKSSSKNGNYEYLVVKDRAQQVLRLGFFRDYLTSGPPWKELTSYLRSRGVRFTDRLPLNR
jgi:hypothetical protein